MNPFSKFLNLLRRQDLDAEMAEEMRHHLEEQTRRNVRAGMPLADAHRAAQRSFGNVASIQEHARDVRGVPWFEELLRDARFAWRMLAKNPGFTTVVVLTLALGIGANTALFSVVHAVLLRPPPYPESDRLVRLSERMRDGSERSVAYPIFRDWREQQSVLEQFSAYRTRSYALSGIAEPVQISVGEISREFLPALRVQPALGRNFTAEDDTPRSTPTVLLSDSLWRGRFGAATDILDRTILLDGRSYSVVGVMPPGFEFPRTAVAWIPLGMLAVGSDWESRTAHSGLFALGRLKPGGTFAGVQAEFDAIAARLETQYPVVNRGRGVQARSLHEAVVGGSGRMVWPLFGAAGLVLLIACANVANLLLARSAVRRKELAVRAALGAGRGRILRQLLVESVLLAGLGCAAGLLLAHGTLKTVVGLMQTALPRVSETKLDAPVLLFSVGAALLAAVIFGLVPAWRASRVDLQEALQTAARGTSGRQGRLRRGLVVLELALTILLLIGAGLMLRSLGRLEAVDPGFNYEHAVTFRVNLSTSKYPGIAQRTEFLRDLLERLRALPGVIEATAASRVPLDGDSWNNEFLVEGQPEPPPGSRPIAEMSRIDPDYFRALGIPLLRGRTFDARDDRQHLRGTGREQDTEAGLNAIIVDEEFARRYWPDRDPIGQRIRFPQGARENQPIATVVGVVGRVKLRGLSEGSDDVQAYVPLAQLPRARLTVVLRTAGDPAAMVAAARQQVLAIDSDQPIDAIRTLEDMRERSGAPQRLSLTLLGIFALAALGLAVVGLYGVLSYLVAQREREIGVRVALGARRRDVLGLILREGLVLALAGTLIGLLAALGTARVLSHLLFEVTTSDPLTFVAVPSLLGAVALLACWVPARRAAKVDPMTALRAE